MIKTKCFRKTDIYYGHQMYFYKNDYNVVRLLYATSVFLCLPTYFISNKLGKVIAARCTRIKFYITRWLRFEIKLLEHLTFIFNCVKVLS